MSEGKLPVIRVKIACKDEDDFHEKFAPIISRKGVFVPSSRPRPVGTRVVLKLELKSGEVGVSGEATVTMLGDQAKRTGMKLKYDRLDDDSFQFELATAAAPAPKLDTLLADHQMSIEEALDLIDHWPGLVLTPPERPAVTLPTKQDVTVVAKPVVAVKQEITAVVKQPAPPIAAPVHVKREVTAVAKAPAPVPVKQEATVVARPAPQPEPLPAPVQQPAPQPVVESVKEPLFDEPEPEVPLPRQEAPAAEPEIAEADEPQPKRSRAPLAITAAVVLVGLLGGGAYLWQQSQADAALLAELKVAGQRVAEGKLIGPSGDEALAHLTRARAMSPADPRVAEQLRALADKFEELGDLASARKGYAEAAVLYQGAVQTDPSRAGARQKFEAAEEAFKTGQPLQPR